MQAGANNAQESEVETWKELQLAGIPVDYDRFAARWDQEEQLPPEQQELHNLVARFDSQGIVLKTKNKEQEHPQHSQGQEQEQGPGWVDSTAMSAASKMF
jgi:hypothetical protein